MRMRNKVNKTGVACCLMACVLCAGCWVMRNWKDYLPISNIGLQNDVHTYVGFFYPQYSGDHALSLMIKTRSDDDTIVELRFKGEIEFVGGGQKQVINFDKRINKCFLPPTPFKIHIATFYADAIEHSEFGRGRFSVSVEGDIAQFLEREPESSICVSLIDGK